MPTLPLAEARDALQKCGKSWIAMGYVPEAQDAGKPGDTTGCR